MQHDFASACWLHRYASHYCPDRHCVSPSSRPSVNGAARPAPRRRRMRASCSIPHMPRLFLGLDPCMCCCMKALCGVLMLPFKCLSRLSTPTPSFMLCHSTSTDDSSYFWVPSAVVLSEINADDSCIFLSSLRWGRGSATRLRPQTVNGPQINTSATYVYPGASQQSASYRYCKPQGHRGEFELKNLR